VAPIGTFQSPNFPGNYPHSRICRWKITVTPGRRITIRFDTFNIEDHRSCRYDYVAVSLLSCAYLIILLLILFQSIFRLLLKSTYLHYFFWYYYWPNHTVVIVVSIRRTLTCHVKYNYVTNNFFHCFSNSRLYNNANNILTLGLFIQTLE